MSSLVTIIAVLSPQTIDKAESISSMLSENFWGIGELVGTVYTESHRAGVYCTIDLACAVVSYLIDGAFSSSRIAEFYKVVSFYAPFMVNNKFHPAYRNLPFTHLEYAMTYGSMWEKVLKIDVKQRSSIGRSFSLNKLKEAVSKAFPTASTNELTSDFFSKTQGALSESQSSRYERVEAFISGGSSEEVFIANLVNMISTGTHGFKSRKKAKILACIGTVIDALKDIPEDEISDDDERFYEELAKGKARRKVRV